MLLTVGGFTYFFVKHPQYLHSLKHISIYTLLYLLGLYALVQLVLVAVSHFTLKLCDKNISLLENFLLMNYSTLVNFFGPLQSGPGFRAVYLKSKHGVRIRDYTLASLIYYGMFALISAVFLGMGGLKLWQTIILVIGIMVVFGVGISWYKKRDKAPNQDSKLRISASALTGLFIFTLLQLILISIIYYIELKTVNNGVSFKHALIYSGAANFALFVSLTPGAIGFRESFLLLSRRLHHISTSVILAASIIDRGVFLVFLGILFIFIVIFHVGKRLKVTTSKQEKPLVPASDVPQN
jgi:uncharacterized membrane protein YbhN (UPF0104 family)